MELTERIEKSYIEPMLKIGNLGDGIEHGFRRLAWSDEETQMHNLVAKIAESYGLHSQTDSIGNLFITSGENMFSEPSVLLASHLDSINCEGTFDGVLGVITALETLKYFKDSDINLPFKVVAGAFRGEESTQYGQALMGSLASVGKLKPELLNKLGKEDIISLEHAIRSQGFDPGAILRGESTINLKNVLAYFEAHIEQSGYLKSKKLDMGVVTGLRASIRYDIKIIGEAAHSGGEPMHLRKDAALVGTDIMYLLNKIFETYAQSHDLVWSSTIAGTNPDSHSTAKVPDEFNIFYDIRSVDDSILDEVDKIMNNVVIGQTKMKDMGYELSLSSRGKPIPQFDQTFIDYETEACRLRGLASEEMQCGPNHDASVYHNISKPTGMILVGGNGISHSKKERADVQEIVNATHVQTDVLKSMASDYIMQDSCFKIIGDL